MKKLFLIALLMIGCEESTMVNDCAKSCKMTGQVMTEFYNGFTSTCKCSAVQTCNSAKPVSSER
jgi:hypothetical protein